MNLAFTTQLPENLPTIIAGKPTHFIPKIWISLIQNGTSTLTMLEYYQAYHQKFNHYWDEPLNFTEKPFFTHPKHHTIRLDTHNRWQAGKKIHYNINARTKKQFQFAPVIPCVSTQTFQIIWHDPDGFKLAQPIVLVDNNWIVGTELQKLVVNDGFNNLDEFLAYFNQPFKGKLIHWTNLKY